LAQGEIKLPYGLRNGELLHISNVKPGLDCGCVCPGCGQQLIAKKGPQKAEHFAHYEADECAGALESALHLAAKSVLENAGRISLPAVRAEFSRTLHIELSGNRSYKIDSIKSETKLGNIIPDLTLDIGGHKLLVEMLVTHGIDEEKLAQIRKLKVSVLEVDLSSAPRDLPLDSISKLVVDNLENKRWVNNERANKLRNELRALATPRRVEMLTDPELNRWGKRSLVGVNGCPELTRRRNGRVTGVWKQDCVYCKFRVGVQDEPFEWHEDHDIFCIGDHPCALDEYKLGPIGFRSKVLGSWEDY